MQVAYDFSVSYFLTSMFPLFAFSFDFVCFLGFASCLYCITCTILYSLFEPTWQPLPVYDLNRHFVTASKLRSRIQEVSLYFYHLRFCYILAGWPKCSGLRMGIWWRAVRWVRGPRRLWTRSGSHWLADPGPPPRAAIGSASWARTHSSRDTTHTLSESDI